MAEMHEQYLFEKKFVKCKVTYKYVEENVFYMPV